MGYGPLNVTTAVAEIVVAITYHRYNFDVKPCPTALLFKDKNGQFDAVTVGVVAKPIIPMDTSCQ
jgi:hypothetical protein